MLKQIEIGHAGQKWQHMVALITTKKETVDYLNHKFKTAIQAKCRCYLIKM